MSHFEDLVGSWLQLCERLEATGTLRRWAGFEPVLGGVSSVRELPRLTYSVMPDRDALIGGLVRTAASAGAGDNDATLVLLHLLRNGATALATRLTDFAPDMLDLVIGELTVQIRQFPIHRRTRSFAANLLLDTKAALMREWLPTRREVASDIRALEAQWARQEQPAPVADVDVADVLHWAESSRVLTADEARLLLAVRHGARRTLADAAGVNERTIRRRYARALSALRTAAPDYLADVA